MEFDRRDEEDGHRRVDNKRFEVSEASFPASLAVVEEEVGREHRRARHFPQDSHDHVLLGPVDAEDADRPHERERTPVLEKIPV